MNSFTTQDGRIFELINGNELVPLSSGFGEPNFPHAFWLAKPERDYVLLLQEAAAYFTSLESGAVSIDNSDYEMDSTKTEGRITPIRPWSVFVEKAVKVHKLSNGTYTYAGDDGRHRYVAAQKNGLALLVEIV